MEAHRLYCERRATYSENQARLKWIAVDCLIVVNWMQIGGWLLKYSAQAGRVSAWVEAKLASSIKKNMVFPSASDFPLPLLMALDHVAVGEAVPGFLAALRPGNKIASPSFPHNLHTYSVV